LIYQYPYCGNAKTQHYDGGVITQPYQFYLTEGSGVVRSFWTLMPSDPATKNLRIWVGAGDIADLSSPPADKLLVDIPLKTLLGMKWGTLSTSEKCTFGFDFDDGGITWWLPIPFEDGILIRFDDTVSTLPNDHGYCWTSYDSGVIPDWPYNAWRLKSGGYSGDLAAEATATYLDEADGPGMLAGLFFGGYQATAEAGQFLENNFELRMNGSETSDWQTSGAEDLFGLNPYYFSKGVRTTRNWGCYYADGTDFKYEAYRWFERDPVIWHAGCQGLFTAGNGLVNPLNLDIYTLYYAP
jgi:hypothetical protein